MPQATLVVVSPVSLAAERIVVQGHGRVVPAHKIQIAARVSGQIVEISKDFVPGGFFSENAPILQIEQRDYQLIEAQNHGNLIKAESDLKLEMGQQMVARREYEILGEPASASDEELLLRRPQLEAKQAAVDIAQASLDKARLDLERTRIIAPFNAVIQARNVDLGAYVNPGAALATLIGTDEYWVEVTLPVDELKWIDIPGNGEVHGSPARVYFEPAWGSQVFREGVVLRLMTDLEPEGRMARVLIAVTDPLQMQKTPDERVVLLLDSFVRVEIDGAELPSIARVPRTAVHDGKYVWIMTPDKTLDIREIEIAWSGPESVLVSGGLQDGEHLVVSDLGTPMPGMLLRTAEDSSPAPHKGTTS